LTIDGPFRVELKVRETLVLTSLIGQYAITSHAVKIEPVVKQREWVQRPALPVEIELTQPAKILTLEELLGFSGAASIELGERAAFLKNLAPLEGRFNADELFDPWVEETEIEGAQLDANSLPRFT